MKRLNSITKNKHLMFIFFLITFYFASYMILNLDFNNRLKSVNAIINQRVEQDDLENDLYDLDNV